MMNNITNQNGRSMIEMLGVLAIVGVLSVGGIAGYSKAMQKYRTNKTIEQVTQIINGVRTLYSGQKNYEGINKNASGQIDSGSSLMKKAKILPESAWDSANDNPKNPFGGKYYLSPSRRESGDNKAVRLSLYEIPDDACIELATQDWGAGEGLFSVSINTDAEYDKCPGLTDEAMLVSCINSANYPLPIPIDLAMEACKNNSNYLNFLFY